MRFQGGTPPQAGGRATSMYKARLCIKQVVFIEHGVTVFHLRRRRIRGAKTAQPSFLGSNLAWGNAASVFEQLAFRAPGLLAPPGCRWHPRGRGSPTDPPRIRPHGTAQPVRTANRGLCRREELRQRHRSSLAPVAARCTTHLRRLRIRATRQFVPSYLGRRLPWGEAASA